MIIFKKNAKKPLNNKEYDYFFMNYYFRNHYIAVRKSYSFLAKLLSKCDRNILFKLLQKFSSR